METLGADLLRAPFGVLIEKNARIPSIERKRMEATLEVKVRNACKKCREEGMFKIIPVGMKQEDERMLFACAGCLAEVLLVLCYHSYVVRNVEWED